MHMARDQIYLPPIIHFAEQNDEKKTPNKYRQYRKQIADSIRISPFHLFCEKRLEWVCNKLNALLSIFKCPNIRHKTQDNINTFNLNIVWVTHGRCKGSHI